MALQERMRVGRESRRVLEVEAPGLRERCRFFNECEAREDRLCCISSSYSELCEEYRRLKEVKGKD